MIILRQARGLESFTENSQKGSFFFSLDRVPLFSVLDKFFSLPRHKNDVCPYGGGLSRVCHSCKDAKYMIAIDRLTYFRFQGHGFFSVRRSIAPEGGTVWGVVPFFEKNSALLQFPPRRDV